MSAVAATSGASSVSKAARASSAPLSRRDANRRRQPSRGGALGCLQHEEMSDLILASQMVPSGRIQTAHCGDKVYLSDAASTAVPSSAEQTPEMNCLASSFPSLAKTSAQAAGWELCSDCSDIDALPDPAIDIEDDSTVTFEKIKANTWWLLGEEDKANTKTEQPEEVSSKPTFADLIRNAKEGDFSPSNESPKLQESRSQGRQRKAVAEEDDFDNEHEYDDQTRQRGWTAQHKASWNVRYQRKVQASKSSRVEQSCRSRGWIE